MLGSEHAPQGTSDAGYGGDLYWHAARCTASCPMAQAPITCCAHKQSMALEMHRLPWRQASTHPIGGPHCTHSLGGPAQPLSPPPHHHQGGPTLQAVSAAMSVALLVPAGHSFSEGSSHSPWPPVLAPQCSTSGVEQSETTCTSPQPSQTDAVTANLALLQILVHVRHVHDLHGLGWSQADASVNKAAMGSGDASICATMYLHKLAVLPLRLAHGDQHLLLVAHREALHQLHHSQPCDEIKGGACL